MDKLGKNVSIKNIFLNNHKKDNIKKNRKKE